MRHTDTSPGPGAAIPGQECPVDASAQAEEAGGCFGESLSGGVIGVEGIIGKLIAELFQEKGYSAASMRDLAGRAGTWWRR